MNKTKFNLKGNRYGFLWGKAVNKGDAANGYFKDAFMWDRKDDKIYMKDSLPFSLLGSWQKVVKYFKTKS